MLATRHYDTNHAPWPIENPNDVASRRPLSPRMSDHYASSFSTQPEWHGDYTYSQQSEEVGFAHPFDRNNHGLPQLRDLPSGSSGKDSNSLERMKEEESAHHGSHTSRDPGQSTSRDMSAGLGHQPHHYRESVDSSESLRESIHPGQGGAVHMSGDSSEADLQFQNRGGSLPTADERFPTLKEEDEDAIDEDDVLDGEGDQPQQPQTAAERTAARRKMKRFRLTHQQTRFLMSEFVKQPHPDAAHRERLSREIPGLSPRQVQVWFQNRRAKIKRLNAEDRDRVIKMRAVPEDFDNIQALHSPYGAMNPLGAPLAAAAELGNASYGEQMARPLVVDVRRPETEDNISPTGLTPAFDGVGFSHHGAQASDMMPNISSATSDRSPFASHLQNSVGGRPRAPNVFPGRLDNGNQYGQQGMRPLQPLHLRDVTTRPRADSLHSPLRSGMSWKGETLDYSQYPMGSSVSPPLPDRQQSMYPMASPSNGNAQNYSTEGFSNSAFHSPTGLEYSSLPQNSRNRPRLRAASATFPLSLETRGDYRPPMTSHSPVHAYSGRSAGVSSQYTSPSIHTTSYPPAPLTAPISMSHQRPSSSRDATQDHAESQLSAPLNVPAEFSGATGHPAGTPHAAVLPMKDPFAGGSTPYGHASGREKQTTFDSEVGGDLLQRKSSFAVQAVGPQGDQMPGSQSHTFDHGSS